MSSPLPLTVFGQFYFLCHSSQLGQNGFNPFPGFPGFPGASSCQPPPMKRPDYTYTPDIGAHKVHKTAATWYDAKQTCRQEGGDLAIINSAAEAKLIVQLLAASGPSAAQYPQWTYVGFHDFFKEGQYEAVNGQSLSDGLYNEWVSGQPDGGTKENCGVISTSEGKLSDGQCDVKYGFVCEIPNLA